MGSSSEPAIDLRPTIEAIQEYARNRQEDVRRGAETPALAALMVEKCGEGMATALHLLGGDTTTLGRKLDALVRQIEPHESTAPLF